MRPRGGELQEVSDRQAGSRAEAHVLPLDLGELPGDGVGVTHVGRSQAADRERERLRGAVQAHRDLAVELVALVLPDLEVAEEARRGADGQRVRVAERQGEVTANGAPPHGAVELAPVVVRHARQGVQPQSDDVGRVVGRRVQRDARLSAGGVLIELRHAPQGAPLEAVVVRGVRVHAPEGQTNRLRLGVLHAVLVDQEAHLPVEPEGERVDVPVLSGADVPQVAVRVELNRRSQIHRQELLLPVGVVVEGPQSPRGLRGTGGRVDGRGILRQDGVTAPEQDREARDQSVKQPGHGCLLH